jgi:hypothetical protein
MWWHGDVERLRVERATRRLSIKSFLAARKPTYPRKSDCRKAQLFNSRKKAQRAQKAVFGMS